MKEIVSIVCGFWILFGTLLHVLGSFGIVRFPDLYNRTHAATKSATLGVIFVLTGALVAMRLEEGYWNAKLLLGIVFVLITSPIGGHLIGRAAYRSKVPLWQQSIRDDLKERLSENDYNNRREI